MAALGAKDFLSKTLNQAAGNIEKAVITIESRLAQEPQVEEAVSQEGGGALPGVGSVGGPLSGMTSGMSFSGGRQAAYAERAFTVQFNPKELNISSSGGGLVQKSNFSGSDGNELRYEPADVRIVANIELIFDQVDPQDAFMADKFATSATSVATGIAKAGLKAAGKKKNSVQDQVEAFVAIIRQPTTRFVGFYWGNICYKGYVTRVNTEYTMFNVSGQPVRGTVRLTLVCADPEIHGQYMGIWMEHYKKAFANKAGDGESFVKAGQKVGNLLNLNL